MLQASTHLNRVRYCEESSAIYIRVSPQYEYQVDMKRCRTAPQALDWIHQVGPDSKTWGRETIADFVHVLFTVLPTTVWSGKA